MSTVPNTTGSSGTDFMWLSNERLKMFILTFVIFRIFAERKKERKFIKSKPFAGRVLNNFGPLTLNEFSRVVNIL